MKPRAGDSNNIVFNIVRIYATYTLLEVEGESRMNSSTHELCGDVYAAWRQMVDWNITKRSRAYWCQPIHSVECETDIEVYISTSYERNKDELK